MAAGPLPPDAQEPALRSDQAPPQAPPPLSPPLSPQQRSHADPFDAPGVHWHQVSPRLATARRIVGAAFVTVVGLLLAAPILAFDLTWLAWGYLVLAAVLGWLWWLIGRQVSAWAYAERSEELLVRSGRVWRKIVVVPYGRLQYVDVDAGPLARAFGIASVQLHTASAGTDAHIPGLEAGEAATLRDRLTERGQAQLAGL